VRDLNVRGVKWLPPEMITREIDTAESSTPELVGQKTAIQKVPSKMAQLNALAGVQSAIQYSSRNLAMLLLQVLSSGFACGRRNVLGTRRRRVKFCEAAKMSHPGTTGEYLIPALRWMERKALHPAWADCSTAKASFWM